MAEVAVVSCFRVNGATEAKVANDFGRTEIKGLVYGLLDSFEANFFSIESIEADGDGMGMANGVGELDFHTVGQAGGDNVLSNIATHVGCAAVDFGGIFSTEGATPVATRPAVGIDDDFAAGETAIAFGSPDDEATSGINEKFCAPIEHLFRENFADELFDNELLDLAMRDVLTVLGRNYYGSDPDGFVLTILNGYLGFGVGSEPGDFARLADAAEFTSEVVREHDWGGHKFRSFAAGKAEHETLIACSLLRGFLPRSAAGINTLGDIGALAGEGVHNVDAVSVKDVFGMSITDGADGGANELIEVQFSAGGDFPCDDDEIGLNQGFAGDAAEGVLGEAGIKHRIGDSVADFVGMAFADRLRGKDEVPFHESEIWH